jgi:hypothetical protein
VSANLLRSWTPEVLHQPVELLRFRLVNFSTAYQGSITSSSCHAAIQTLTMTCAAAATVDGMLREASRFESVVPVQRFSASKYKHVGKIKH